VAVILNVTAVDPTDVGYTTVWPSDVPRPTVSNLNFEAGQTVAGLVTIRLSSSGNVSIYNYSGHTNLVVDAFGWYDDGSTLGARYNAVPPTRILDTRNGIGTDQVRPLQPGETRLLRVIGSVPGSAVDAVTINLTAVGPSGGGYLTVWPDDGVRPTVSSLNFAAGQTVANLVTVRVSSSGYVAIYNPFGQTDVLVDLLGWYDGSALTGSVFVPLDPFRELDTRQISDGALGAGESGILELAGRNGIPPTGTTAVVATVTVTNATSTSYLTVYPDSATMPPTISNLNWTLGRTVPNLVVAPLSNSGAIAIYNAFGTVDVLVDVVGCFVPP
jgi:hypothetical protein